MKKIDLTKEYPHLDATYTDYPVSDVYAVFEQSRLDEQAQAKRRKRNGDVISLDTHPNVERYAITPEAGTEEKTMNHIQNKALHQALQSIPHVQAKRLYLYYFSGMTLEEIAHMEGVSKVAIHKSIQLGKANLKKILSNAFL